MRCMVAVEGVAICEFDMASGLEVCAVGNEGVWCSGRIFRYCCGLGA